MSGTVLNASNELAFLTITSTLWGNYYFILILQVRKLKHREVKHLSHEYTASKLRVGLFKLRPSDSRTHTFITMLNFRGANYVAQSHRGQGKDGIRTGFIDFRG